VINLIENAIKAAESSVLVTSQVAKSPKALIEITIQDDGPGIPAKRQWKTWVNLFISTRKDSMGIAFFLPMRLFNVHRVIFEMFNLKNGGAMSIIRLPCTIESEPNRHPRNSQETQ